MFISVLCFFYPINDWQPTRRWVTALFQVEFQKKSFARRTVKQDEFKTMQDLFTGGGYYPPDDKTKTDAEAAHRLYFKERD